MSRPTTAMMPKFQLHHTGIKTTSHRVRSPASSEFQLHHTGIKTR